MGRAFFRRKVTGGSLLARFPPGTRVLVHEPAATAGVVPARRYVGLVGVVERVLDVDGFLRVKVRFDGYGLPPLYAGAAAKYLEILPADEGAA